MLKNCRTIVVAIMVFSLSLFMFLIVKASDTNSTNDIANKIEILDLKYAIKDINQWDYFGENTISKDNQLQIKGTDKISIAGYKGKKFKDELFNFSIRMEIENSWQGFVLRAQKDSVSLPWAGNSGYLIVIKPNTVELQKWLPGPKQEVLAVIPNDGFVRDKTMHTMLLGAMSKNGSTNILWYVDGKAVINFVDKNSDFSEGYLCFYTNKTSIYLSGANDISKDTAPFVRDVRVITNDEKLNLVRPSNSIGRNKEIVGGTATIGSTLKGAYDFIDLGDGIEDGSKYRWLISGIPLGEEDKSEFTNEVKKIFPNFRTYTYKEILGATEKTYVVKPEDHGKYIKFEVIPKSQGNMNVGIAVQSRAFFVDALAEKMNKSLFLFVGSPISYVDGVEKRIDADNSKVAPSIKEGRTLVPVRFIAESFGANVSWDEATSEVSVSLNDKLIKMKLGSNIINVNGVENVLDVPAQSINGRTLIPLRALSEAIGKNVFWDDRGLIVIHEKDNIFDIKKESSLIEEAIFLLKI